MSSNTPNDTLPLSLTPSDMLGIIQRQLSECNAYLSQHPSYVRREIVLEYLDRARSIASMLRTVDMMGADQPKN